MSINPDDYELTSLQPLTADEMVNLNKRTAAIFVALGMDREDLVRWQHKKYIDKRDGHEYTHITARQGAVTVWDVMHADVIVSWEDPYIVKAMEFVEGIDSID